MHEHLLNTKYGLLPLSETGDRNG